MGPIKNIIYKFGMSLRQPQLMKHIKNIKKQIHQEEIDKMKFPETAEGQEGVG